MAKSIDEQILHKLEQILRVLSIQVAADKSFTERAKLLKMAGLDNQAIADVLNISIASVRTLTSNLRVKVGGTKKR
jgi:DNA-binding CsgD family transcriptional regulator